MNHSEKIKVIANTFSESDADKRNRSEVYDHMIDWHSKGWLSQAFVDDCYAAIERGDHVEFQYIPGKSYGYLAGTKDAWSKTLGVKL